MPSELERIANRLRVLSRQADQHRAHVYEASAVLKQAAAVAGGRFLASDGTERPAPTKVVVGLSSAAGRAEAAVVPLGRAATLLRQFAATLAPGGAAASGEAPSDPAAAPGAAASGAAASGGEPASGQNGPTGAPAPAGDPAPSAWPTWNRASEESATAYEPRPR